MSFTDDYLANRKKKKKEEKKTVSGGNSFTKEYLSEKDDIAPVASTPQLLLPVRTGVAPTANTFTAPVRTTTKTKDDSRKWFDKGLFDDGYQFGDVTKTILGTAGDIGANLGAGILDMGESALDALVTVAPYVARGQAYQNGAVYNLEQQKAVEEAFTEGKKWSSDFVAKDLYSGEEIAKSIINTDPYSVLGEKSDSLIQSGGQLLGTVGLSFAGVPWFLTTGVTSFGSEAEQAFNEGATSEEAILSGVVSAGAEILTEKISGGIKFGGKALDDGITTVLSRTISDKTARALAKAGFDMVGEGGEEILSGYLSAIGQKLTYMDDKELNELFTSEEAMDSFIGGAVLGGVSSGYNAVKSNKAGVDSVSGLTANEEAVVKKVYDARLAEEGDLTQSQKNKLYNSVVEDMDKGYISIDTIEEVLGGDTYKSYRETVDSEDALAKEFEELGNKQNATLAEQSRYNELKQQLEDMKQNSQRDTLKTKLSEEVFGIAKDSRLAESYAERSRRGQAFEADLAQYDSKQQEVVKRAAESGILNNTRRTHEFVDLISKISADKGVLFDFTNNERLKESGFAVGGKTVDGYVTKDGITLNMDSPKAWQTTVGHEITHVLEGTELYDSLRTTIFEYAKSKGEYDSRLADIQERYKGIENADYEAELTSDLVGDYLFADENFIKHLSVENRNVFQKIYDEVKYMLKVVTAGSKEARQLEKVKRAFDRVYKEGGKTQSEAKYSVSDESQGELLERLMAKRKELQDSDVLQDELEDSEEYNRLIKEIVSSGASPEALAKYKEWDEKTGYSALVAKNKQLAAEARELAKQHDNAIREGWKQEESVAIAKSGLSESDYFRKKAVKEFGYTPYFYDAGYITTNGKMLNFSGEKGQHYGVRGQDHRAIGMIYADTEGTAALNRFVKDGNIRIMAESPGIDISAATEPTKEQYATIRKFANEYSDKGYFSVDLTGEDGRVVGSLTYENRINPTRILNDIKHYYATGEIRQQSDVDRLRYSVSDSDGKQLSKEQQEYFKDSKMRDDNGNLKVMYHGSQDAGFHVFDARMSDDDTSFFFVDSNDVAATYSGTSETYEATAFRTVEDANKFFEKIGKSEYEVVEENGKYTLLDDGDEVATSESLSEIYDEFRDYEGVGYGDANYKVYLNLTNPLEVDAKGRPWNKIDAEFSQEVYDKFQSLTAEEKDALVDLAGWEDFRIFNSEIQEARGNELASAYQKLSEDINIYDVFSVASDNFSEESMRENSRHYLKTRDYAQRAKAQGYDGVIFKNIVDNGGYSNGDEGASTVAIAFDSNQIKSVANEKPTADKDIRYSLSEDSEGRKLSDDQAEYFKDSKARDENGRLQTVYHGTRNADFTVFKRNANYYTSSKETAESYAPSGAMYEGYVNITNPFVIDAQGEKWSGIAIDNDLKKMLESYGSSTFKERGKWRTTTADIVAAISDMVDEGEADYDGVIIHNVDDTGSYFKGKGGAIGTDYITFSSNQFKNIDNVKPTADSDIHRSLSDGVAPVGKGVPLRDLRYAPVGVAENATTTQAEKVAPAVAPVADNTVPEGFAPATEDEANAMRTEAFQTVDDADMPPETEAPYQPRQEVTVDDPFEDRDWYEVGNRKVKAYMYENPEVKPFFQEEAAVMLDELNSTTKGERWYDDHVYYDTGGEAGWGGTKRHTSDSIAEMLDGWKMSYDDIEKGLKAIIEDHGAENIAAAKKIEFMLNERLLNGYTSFVGFEPTMDKWGNVPPNQSYLAMLEEKQVTEYSKEAFDALMADADRYAPVGISETETTSPVAIAENATTTNDFAPVAPAYEVVSDKKGEIKGQQAITKEDAATGKTANVLVEEPEVEKKQSAWSKFKNLVLDKGMVFEDLSLRTGNRELQARWNSIRYARNKAQRLMEKGNASVSSLDSIRKTVEGKGKEYTQKFYEYLYHMHNIDRMSLETEENRVKREGLQVQFQGYTDEQLSDLATSWITKDTPQDTVDRIKAAREYVEAKKNGNKPVFGDDVTADISRKTASKMEKANPEFKEYAQEVYGYMNYLRGMLVDNGVISNETAKLWAELYPHYVPIRRLGDTGLNINVPLDTGRTGVNAPVKRATGGSRDILPLFDTMGQRTMQTYSAVAKNRFGVELKNTLGTTIGSEAMGLDEAIDSIDTQDGLLQEGKKGKKPTFTVFEDGKRVTFEITEEMYDAMKPTSDALAYTNKVASAVSDFRRSTLTQYNPWFMLKNAIKDVQDVLINSQHAARTYVTIPKAISQMVSNGQWYTEYMENGGEDNSYFDSQTNTFKSPNPTIEAIKKYTGLNAIAKANNIIERLPRLAEYIASREAGRSVDVAMLDAARVTTNFAAGGDLTKFLNRNGATFLNASFQGAMQQVRNVREAKRAGVKGVLNLAAKFAVAGLPAIALNALIWGDDEEYDELSDYVKQSYYIVGKTEDGKFIRIPKGRTVAVIQNGFEQMQHLITGDDEADLGTFLDLLLTNLAPNNPIDNNILSPIIDVAQNKTWYGEDLVPTRLQDVPNAEQYDESTDSLSRWLGETFNVSPYKTNYLLDQYGGIISDTFLPMLTPEAESGNDTLAGNLIAPLKDMFTTDSVMNNQNVSDFYDTKDELTKAANSMYATDEDVLKAKYMNSVNSEMGKLYGEKRELQNSDMPDAEKYEAVREVQRQIDELAKSGLDTYNEVLVSGGYATVGDRHYRKKDGEWSKLTDEQLEKQEEVTSGLGISPADYWSDKEEYDFAYEKPEKYAVAKAVGGYTSYKDYSDELYDIKADKDENGDSIRNSRKEKVIDWVNNLDLDYGARLILFKSEYNADDTYNYEIIEYLNSRDDISYAEMETILKELGFDVDANGNISWD